MTRKRKLPRDRRNWVLFACAVLALLVLASCSSKKQDALLDYINKDLVEIGEIESKMLESYNSVSGVNYTDDQTMYDELIEVTLPLCQELTEAVQNISPDDTEIARVHNIYRKYVTKCLNAFAMMISALETQDVSQVVSANDLLTEGSDLALDFQEALQKLADERDVVFE